MPHTPSPNANASDGKAASTALTSAATWELLEENFDDCPFSLEAVSSRRGARVLRALQSGTSTAPAPASVTHEEEDDGERTEMTSSPLVSLSASTVATSQASVVMAAAPTGAPLSRVVVDVPQSATCSAARPSVGHASEREPSGSGLRATDACLMNDAEDGNGLSGPPPTAAVFRSLTSMNAAQTTSSLSASSSSSRASTPVETHHHRHHHQVHKDNPLADGAFPLLMIASTTSATTSATFIDYGSHVEDCTTTTGSLSSHVASGSRSHADTSTAFSLLDSVASTHYFSATGESPSVTTQATSRNTLSQPADALVLRPSLSGFTTRSATTADSQLARFPSPMRSQPSRTDDDLRSVFCALSEKEAREESLQAASYLKRDSTLPCPVCEHAAAAPAPSSSSAAPVPMAPAVALFSCPHAAHAVTDATGSPTTRLAHLSAMLRQPSGLVHDHECDDVTPLVPSLVVDSLPFTDPHTSAIPPPPPPLPTFTGFALDASSAESDGADPEAEAHNTITEAGDDAPASTVAGTAQADPFVVPSLAVPAALPGDYDTTRVADQRPPLPPRPSGSFPATADDSHGPRHSLPLYSPRPHHKTATAEAGADEVHDVQPQTSQSRGLHWLFPKAFGAVGLGGSRIGRQTTSSPPSTTLLANTTTNTTAAVHSDDDAPTSLPHGDSTPSSMPHRGASQDEGSVLKSPETERLGFTWIGGGLRSLTDFAASWHGGNNSSNNTNTKHDEQMSSEVATPQQKAAGAPTMGSQGAGAAAVKAVAAVSKVVLAAASNTSFPYATPTLTSLEPSPQGCTLVLSAQDASLRDVNDNTQNVNADDTWVVLDDGEQSLISAHLIDSSSTPQTPLPISPQRPSQEHADPFAMYCTPWYGMSATDAPLQASAASGGGGDGANPPWHRGSLHRPSVGGARHAAKSTRTQVNFPFFAPKTTSPCLPRVSSGSLCSFQRNAFTAVHSDSLPSLGHNHRGNYTKQHTGDASAEGRLSEQLYALFASPPSVDLAGTAHCLALFESLQEREALRDVGHGKRTRSRGVRCDSILSLLNPEEIVSHGNLFPRGKAFVSLSEFAEFIEVVSVQFQN